MRVFVFIHFMCVRLYFFAADMRVFWVAGFLPLNKIMTSKKRGRSSGLERFFDGPFVRRYSHIFIDVTGGDRGLHTKLDFGFFWNI